MYKADYKFIKKDSEGNTVIVKLDNGVTLQDIFESFDSFLKASGFNYRGYVTIEEDPMEVVYDKLLDDLDDNTTSGAV